MQQLVDAASCVAKGSQLSSRHFVECAIPRIINAEREPLFGISARDKIICKLSEKYGLKMAVGAQ